MKVLPSRRIIGTSKSIGSPRDNAGPTASLIALNASSDGHTTRCCWFCSAPRGQPNISSKRALVITMRRSRVNEMPTSAFSRIASRSRRACSLAVTSRALVIWYSMSSIVKRAADTSIETRRRSRVCIVAGKFCTLSCWASIR